MRSVPRWLASLALLGLLPLRATAQEPVPPPALLAKPTIVYKVQSPTERLEMTVHTSRILTMDQKIPQAQVNNPDLLELTPLSPNQIQISAKATGVTQVNLWDEHKKLYTVDVIVLGDVRELTMVLRSTFPNAAIKVTPVANSVLISGFVDQPAHIDRIIRIAEEYYPKVINNMTVGGCQQVLLHVKVMEVSRTKLRQLGFDFSKITGSNVVSSSPSGGLSSAINTAPSTSTTTPWTPVTVTGEGTGTFTFGITNGTSAFLGVLNALRKDDMLKIMAEPTLVTVSGRPASFNSGGEIPIPVPQSLGTISIEWKKYGTQIDFVPIVLGNGRIRLEVRPRISELDPANSLLINGSTVPGILSRDADTGVEMEAGQTLAIAGLVQSYTEAHNSGLPWVSDLPYLGALFRNVKETKNEVELLIMVTPELVEAMDVCDVPRCGPGMETTDPSDWELFMKGHLEVPTCRPDCRGEKGAQNGDRKCDEGDPNAPPSDGMVGSNDATPPSSSNASGQQNRRNPSKTNARTPGAPAGEHDVPPGFVGPVGYDVVK